MRPRKARQSARVSRIGPRNLGAAGAAPPTARGCWRDRRRSRLGIEPSARFRLPAVTARGRDPAGRRCGQIDAAMAMQATFVKDSPRGRASHGTRARLVAGPQPRRERGCLGIDGTDANRRTRRSPCCRNWASSGSRPPRSDWRFRRRSCFVPTASSNDEPASGWPAGNAPERTRRLAGAGAHPRDDVYGRLRYRFTGKNEGRRACTAPRRRKAVERNAGCRASRGSVPSKFRTWAAAARSPLRAR
ncbi:MAG: hypothetical protein H6Q86_5059 [candidate division NC10 bacterium]|nr:hypothetical protein [candidate division NC10 bacterium]